MLLLLRQPDPVARDAPGGLCAEQGTSGMMVTSQSLVVTYPPHMWWVGQQGHGPTTPGSA